MDNVTEIIFSDRQALANAILDRDNPKIIAIFLDEGDFTWDFIGDVGRYELIGVLHDLINQQLNYFEDEE